MRVNPGVAVAWLALVLTAWSCRPDDDRPACDPSFAAVAGASERLIASDNARNLGGVLGGYTDDVVWVPPTGEVLSGKAALRPRYEQLFSGFTIDLSSEVAEARADGSLGYARGFTNGTLTPVNGGAPIIVHDKFLALVRCEAGAWRVSHLMWSPRAQP